MVADLSLAGWAQTQIAYAINIDDETLRKYYERELHEPVLKAGAVLVKSLYEDAMNGCKDSRKFFLTHRCKWAPYKRPEEVITNGKQYVLVEYQDKVIVNDSNKTNDSRSTDICS